LSGITWHAEKVFRNDLEFVSKEKFSELEGENEKLKYLLECAVSIEFVEPILFGRDVEGDGKWMYQRE
jgi:hypothetical protein